MSVPDPRTLAVYSDKAESYSELHHGSETERRLAAFIEALPAGGTVLDLGCGPGWAAAAMHKAGLCVSAMDACPDMARVARQRYGLTVQVAPFSDLDAEDAFDGIWAHFSLLHAPRGALPGHLAAIHRALRPGGRFVVAMKRGTGEGRDRLGRLYTFVERDELAGLLGAAGFSVIGEECYAGMGFDGTPSACIHLTAQRD